MKTRVRMVTGEVGINVDERGMLGCSGLSVGDESLRICCAVRRGPIVFVLRWWANAENVLYIQLILTYQFQLS